MVPELKDEVLTIVCITGFCLYSMPLDISIEGKRKGLLGTLSSLDIYSLRHFPIILVDVKNVPQFTHFINFVSILFEKTKFSMASCSSITLGLVTNSKRRNTSF